MVIAGMDTIANSLARILQLLAPNPDVRTRLRDDSLCAPSKPRLLAGCSTLTRWNCRSWTHYAAKPCECECMDSIMLRL